MIINYYWSLALPLTLWIWHAVSMFRSKKYPLLSFTLALISCIFLIAALWVIAVVAYPPEKEFSMVYRPGHKELIESLFLALILWVPMMALEPLLYFARWLMKVGRPSVNETSSQDVMHE